MANLSTKFFWIGGPKRTVVDPFWWIFLTILVFWVPFLRVWWWVFVPLFLSIQLKDMYFWWLRWDYAYIKERWYLLEIIPPKEVLIPFKAMEDVFSVIWPIWDAANFRELWCEGELDNAPFWMSWELASIEGKIHFYARILQQHRSLLESILYSYYPEIEIHEASDYTKNVPSSIPNEEWDIYGEDFVQAKPPAYPIKTFEEFFEPQGEKISAEEKRIDPIISLLEAMSKLGPGEQYWLQYIINPISDADDNWRDEAKKIMAKLARRPEKKTRSFMEDLMNVVGELILGPKKEGSGPGAKYSWITAAKSETGEEGEMILTPGERDVLTKIETKIKKPVFRIFMRGVYVAKRSNWKATNRTILRSYTSHFKTENMNYLSFSGLTRTKVHYIMRKRRVYFRARRMFRNYILRFPPLFPDRQNIAAILSTEEIATLFHFPVKITGSVAPAAPRVEFKKAGPPPNLPV
ncbi:MAG: hypothetical protein HYT36_00455 [Candidatus Staskawiczbacteria bacterium]|nr:hypothetical protein [Candidatus Staskawiczbacteria bacterium]